MDDPGGQIKELRSLITEQIEKCTDCTLLDLIYKLLIYYT